MAFEYKQIPLSQINMIQPLWAQLNGIHLKDAHYFKSHYEQFTFEQRIVAFNQYAPHQLFIEVLFEDTNPIGYIIATINGSIGEIDSLHLHEDYRGNGYGKELVNHGLAFINSQGCEEIIVCVSEGHESVFGFYESFGFYPRMHQLKQVKEPMLCLKDVQIQTDRIIQVPIDFSYLKDIYLNFTSEITKYMFPAPGTVENYHDFIRDSLEGIHNNTNLQLVMLDKKTKEFLGCSGLHALDSNTPEFGIWLKKEAHHKGYGKEAITGIYEYAKKNIKYDYIKYPVDRDNTSSRKIPESLGGIIHKEYTHTGMAGNILNIVEYKIT